MAVLEVEDLSVHYLTRFGKKVQAVSQVSFELEKGEILGIAGESGCGKTTLVSGCMGLYIPPLHHSSGDVRIDGQSLIGMSTDENRKEVLGRKISMIPQGALNSLNPTRKIQDMAWDMMISHGGKPQKQEFREHLEERFARLGLNPKEILGAYPVELPAGTKQRVVIGLSTLLNPKVVVADEPTSALDVSTQKAVIRLLFDLMDQDIISSMIFITHELPLLRHVATKIAVMYAGEFVEYGSTKQVIFDGRQPYTQALMGSMLSAVEGQRDNQPISLEGAPPNLAHPISGCRFSERCPAVKSDCAKTEQELLLVSDRLVRCAHAK